MWGSHEPLWETPQSRWPATVTELFGSVVGRCGSHIVALGVQRIMSGGQYPWGCVPSVESLEGTRVWLCFVSAGSLGSAPVWDHRLWKRKGESPGEGTCHYAGCSGKGLPLPSTPAGLWRRGTPEQGKVGGAGKCLQGRKMRCVLSPFSLPKIVMWITRFCRSTSKKRRQQRKRKREW